MGAVTGGWGDDVGLGKLDDAIGALSKATRPAAEKAAKKLLVKATSKIVKESMGTLGYEMVVGILDEITSTAIEVYIGIE